jgi:hypothetical protein
MQLPPLRIISRTLVRGSGFQTGPRVTLRHNRSGEDREECPEEAFLGRADHRGVAASGAGRADRRSLSQGRGPPRSV